MSITIEQLLATLAIDSADVTVVSERYVIIQRDPQPDEIGIDIDTDIEFLLVDLNGDPYDPPSAPGFTIFVEELMAGIFGGGTFVPTAPWTGGVVETTETDPFVGWYVTLVQPALPLFGSEQVVNVKVSITTSGGYGHDDYGHFPWGHAGSGPTIDIEWEFTIEDLTPPCLLEAVPIDLFTVRLTFDDNMAVSGDGSVLDLDKWPGTITRHNVDPLPGVNLAVVGVEEVAGSDGVQFDLTVGWEMTQGCPYTVTVSALLEDTSGNAMGAECRSADFVGFQIAPVVGRRFDMWGQMMPLKNRQEDLTRDLERSINCFKEVIGLLLDDVDGFTDQFDPDTATDAQIDVMLCDLGNPFEWVDLTLLERRTLVQFLVEIYKQKGTRPGIINTIWFLLNEQVTVEAASDEGWVLGEDELGEGSIAEVLCDAGEPWDFSVPRTLRLKTDGYVDEQEILFEPGDFVAPANALAAEVVAVVKAQIQNGGAYVVRAGTPAEYVLPAAPFALSGGEYIQLTINGRSQSVVFHVGDFASPGNASVEEVAARFAADLRNVIVSIDGALVVLTTVHTGEDAAILFYGGTALAPLGITPGDSASGTDAKRVAIYSSTEGPYAWVEITGGTANDVLEFDTDVYGGTGGAILAPGTSYALYSFDIVTETQLDQETTDAVRRIGEYMKVAHEHLINIRPERALPWPDGWVIGVSELGVTTELAL